MHKLICAFIVRKPPKTGFISSDCQYFFHRSKQCTCTVTVTSFDTSHNRYCFMYGKHTHDLTLSPPVTNLHLLHSSDNVLREPIFHTMSYWTQIREPIFHTMSYWTQINLLHSQLAHIVGPPTARQRYAIQWRIAGGPLVARRCVLAGRGAV